MKKLNINWKSFNWRDWPELHKLRHDAFLAFLSYIHIFVLIPLIFGRKDEFVHYHAKQGVLVLALWFLFGFSLFFPYIPWLFLILITVCIVSGIINVLLGKKRPMLLLGKWAEKLSV